MVFSAPALVFHKSEARPSDTPVLNQIKVMTPGHLLDENIVLKKVFSLIPPE